MKIIKASEFNENDKGFVLYLTKNEVRLLDNWAALVLNSAVAEMPGTANTRTLLQSWRTQIIKSGVTRVFNYFSGAIHLLTDADGYLNKEKP